MIQHKFLSSKYCHIRILVTPLISSNSSYIMMSLSFSINKTGIISETGTVYPSEAHEHIRGFLWGSYLSIFSILCSVVKIISLLAIVFSVLQLTASDYPLTASDYPVGVCKHFLVSSNLSQTQVVFGFGFWIS